MRAFFALPLSEPFRLALAAALRRFEAADPSALSAARCTRPDAMHVTLAFLGEISGAGAELAAEALRSAVEKARVSGRVTGPFSLAAGGVQVFPPRGRASVVAASVADGAAEAAALATALEEALEAMGRAGRYAFRPREARAYTPHVTLARFPRPGARIEPASVEALHRAVEASGAQCAVDRAVLYSSTPAPGGSRYEVVAEARLGE